ncbi:unnamed protein product [Zymoseptoria tritici ST99CH_1E4]|uniref:PD-(D/E)XK nuclease-like domain-containing protein n=1 Tax=Zymoseptoria tritici ST99CH_1E4 TaxID=1276532 RepID=A0A2H1H9S9_ZYMTR|nr:unnamed protein product [Zymoseptoria tritici ST99CH_1E4]
MDAASAELPEPSSDTLDRETQRRRLSHTHTPIFPTRSPSLSRRRSASPTKTQSIALHTTGVPRVVIETGAVGKTEDAETRTLYSQLQSAIDGPVIPHEFIELIGEDEIIPPSYFRQPTVAEGAQSQGDAADARRLWTRIGLIRKKAHRSENFRDENSWTDVVKLVLATVLYHCDEEEEARSGNLQIINLQTQSIAQDHLPRMSDAAGVCDRRVDLALGVDDPLEDTPAARLRERAFNNSLPLNHMKDLELQRAFLALPIEIKAKNGNMEEAHLQLAVYFAAAVKFLTETCAATQIPPMLGWTVLGSSWTPMLAWRDGKGVVQVRQLNALGSFGTSDCASLFRLFALLKECVKWVQNEYQPKHSDLMERFVGEWERGNRLGICKTRDLGEHAA